MFNLFDRNACFSVLCPGCPLRGVFYVLAQMKEAEVCGKFQCGTPFRAQDATPCDDGCASVPSGMVLAERETGHKKILVLNNDADVHCDWPSDGAMVCDGVVPLIMDDAQRVERVSGYQLRVISNLSDLTAIEDIVYEALESEAPAAILVRYTCLLNEETVADTVICEVDPFRCLGCGKCLRVACPALGMEGKKSAIRPDLCAGCTVCAQICPVDAIARNKKRRESGSF